MFSNESEDFDDCCFCCICFMTFDSNELTVQHFFEVHWDSMALQDYAEVLFSIVSQDKLLVIKNIIFGISSERNAVHNISGLDDQLATEILDMEYEMNIRQTAAPLSTASANDQVNTAIEQLQTELELSEYYHILNVGNYEEFQTVLTTMTESMLRMEEFEMKS